MKKFNNKSKRDNRSSKEVIFDNQDILVHKDDKVVMKGKTISNYLFFSKIRYN